jgi:predicted  nucleic acid-binding Zn-ribbon protein
VKESIEKLITLQNIDNEIRQNRIVWEKTEQEISRMEKTAVESQKEYDLLLQQIEENQKQRRQKERNLETKETDLKKYKGQLFQIKTNREYEAMLEEIATTETDINLLEEDILRLMEEGDGLKEKSQEKKKQVDKEKEEFQRIMAEKRQKISGIEDIIKDQENQRPKIIEGLEKNIVIEYEKLLETRQGQAVVTAKNGVCSGCFVSMRPQMFEELKRNDKIFYCQSCSRFLYWDHNR